MSIGRTSPTDTGGSSGSSSSTGGRTTKNSRRSVNNTAIMGSNDTTTTNNTNNSTNINDTANAVKNSTTMPQTDTTNAANSNKAIILQNGKSRVNKSFIIIIFTTVILSLLLIVGGYHQQKIYDKLYAIKNSGSGGNSNGSSNGMSFSLSVLWDKLNVLKINGGSTFVNVNDSENKDFESNDNAKTPPQQQHNNAHQNNNAQPGVVVVQSSIKKHKNAARGVDGTVMKEMLRGYPLNVYLDEDLGFYSEDSGDEESSSDDDDNLEDDDSGDGEEEEERLDGVDNGGSDEEGDVTKEKETKVDGVDNDDDKKGRPLLEEEEVEDDEGELSLKETLLQQKKSDKNKKEDEQDHEDSSDDDDEEEEEEEFYDVKAASRAARRYAVQFGTSSSSSSTSLSSSSTSSNNSTTPLERAMQQAKNVMDIMNKKNNEKNHARVWESGDLAVLKIKLLSEDDDSGGEVVEIEGDDSDDDDSEDSEDDDVKNEIEEKTEEGTAPGGRKKKKLFDAFKKKKRKLKGQLAREEESSDDDEDEEEGESDDHEEEEEEEDSSDDMEEEGEEESSSDDDDSESAAAMKTLKQRMLKQNAVTADTKKELTLPNLAKQTPEEAAHTILSSSNGITSNLQDRLSTMFAKAKTHECRAKIAEHFALFVNGLAMETKFPFQDWYYPNTCTAIPYYDNWDDLPPDVNLHELHHRVYQPPKDTVPEGTYIENADDLELAYVILTHDQPESTIRLIESLYVENMTKFVVHVDGKEQADETYVRLVEYAQEKNLEQQQQQGGKGGEYIRIVPNDNRVRVNWGGFSMVNATLVAMKTLFGLDYYAAHPEEKVPPGHDNPHAFSFHKMIHLASTTYPLASNTEIRDTLASYPLDANFLHILLQPNDPTPQVWNYFVECDDALHRIYRLPPLTADKGHGIDVYTSSQWFIISREFAWYLAKPPKNSLAEYFREYAEHVVVADESYFGTVLRNTHFCSTLHNDNFLHIQFGSWENESKEANKRDPRKCVMRNPDHCGRSPTTMTLDYLPVLELSGDLFARKFDDVAEPLVKDYIDKRRAKEEERFIREEALAKEIDANKTAGVEVTKKLPLEEWEFEGEGVMLVAKETVSDETPLCLGLTRHGANRVHLLPCFKEDVPPTLDPDWYTGAVIIEEIEHYNRWDLGPCSSDGELKRNETTGELEMTPGDYSQTGPKCMVKVGDSIRKGRCLDAESDRTKPGSFLNIFPCEAKWHQLFSFGNGDLIPSGAVHLSLPKHLATKDSTTHLCIGVQGRSDEDKVEWLRPEHDDDPDGLWPWEYSNATEYYANGYKSLKYWNGIHLQTTPCSNEGAVIEFFYVPFIVEEYAEYSAESASVVEEKKGAEERVVGDEL